MNGMERKKANEESYFAIEALNIELITVHTKIAEGKTYKIISWLYAFIQSEFEVI